MRASPLHKLAGAHAEGVWAAAWLPGGDQLLTGSVDETVKLWDASAGAGAGDAPSCAHTFSGFSLGVVSLAVDSATSLAAATALDGFIRCWDPATHASGAIIEAPPTEAWGVAFAPPAAGSGAAGGAPRAAVAGGSTGCVTVYRVDGDAATVEASLQLPMPEGAAPRRDRFTLAVAFSPDGRQLAASGMDGSVAVFDAASGALLHSCKGHHKPVRALTYTPDSKLLLTASDDMHANLYDAHSGGLVDAFSGHESWVLNVVAHPGGAAFATCSSDARVKLWDLGTRTCIQTMGDHTDQVWALAFNADGSRLISGGDDKLVTVYSVA